MNRTSRFWITPSGNAAARAGFFETKKQMTNEPRPTHGGKREGAGRKPSEGSRSVPKSIKVSQEVADYLTEKGTGIVEDMIRKSKSFKAWRQSAK